MRICMYRVIISLIVSGFPIALAAETVSYEFEIATAEVNFTGATVPALAIDGQIPAPTITAAVGDLLRVTFRNRLDKTTTVHWHGILLPPDQDGVAYLNTQPIAPGGTHTFEFPITHAGTFWYHSHTDLQIQKGLYGAVVLTDPQVDSPVQDEVVLFSDWTDEPVANVLRNLKSEDDFYMYERGTIQSWDRVIANGPDAIRNRLNSAYTRMGPMDLSDVKYDAFLVNGQPENAIAVTEPGAEQMKLRLVNGSTSSYFDVEYAGGPMTIIAADGQDVVPVRAQRLRISTAETYDVLIPLQAGTAWELRATSFDGSGYSRLFIGEGTRVSAPDIPPPNLYLMDHMSMNMDMGTDMDMGMDMPGQDHDASQPMDHSSHGASQPMDHSSHGDPGMMSEDVIAHMTDYEALMAPVPTTLPADQDWREISLALTGAMERYVWSFDGKTFRESPQIMIRRGENVRVNLSNETMMHHPLHLHGHFFRVVNQHGERSPLKHTVNVPPMGNVVIEFDANEERDWLFHCHNQYHMKSGMNRVVSYEETSQFTPDISALIQPAQRFFSVNEFHLMSSFADYEFSVFDERHEWRLEVDADLADSFEIHAQYAYHFNRFVSAFVGMESREHHHEDNHDIAIAGLDITLPMLIDSEWRFDDHGDFRLELMSEIPLTQRLGIDWRWNTDNEYRYGLNFRINRRLSLTVHTDTEYGDGIGMKYFY